MQLALRRLIGVNQSPGESNDHYHVRFKGHAKAIVKQWGEFSPSNLADGTTDSEKKKAEDKMLAMIYLGGVDKRRFGGMLDDWNNSFVTGEDKYPGRRIECDAELAGPQSRWIQRRQHRSSTTRFRNKLCPARKHDQ